MADFFIRNVATVKKRKQDPIEAVKDPVLYEDAGATVTIITAQWLAGTTLTRFLRYLRNQVGEVPLRILYAFRWKLEKYDDPKLVESAAIDWGKWLIPGSHVVTLGNPVLRALTRNSDIQTSVFYDSRWNKTYFFAPKAQSWVFPADLFNMLWDRRNDVPFDSFTTFHLCNQLKRALSPIPRTRVIEPVICHVEDPNAFLRDHMEPKEVAWDLETRGFRFNTHPVICLTLSFDGVYGYFLPWDKIDPKVLEEFFSNKFQIGANLKFDCKFMRFMGVSTVKVDFDTLHAGHCINEMRSNSLKTHAFIYTEFGGYDDDLEDYKERFPDCKNDYGYIPFAVLRPYAVMDAIVNFRVYLKMKRQLAEDPLLERYYYQDVLPSVNMYLEIELRGFEVNWDKVREAERVLLKDIADMEQRIFTKLGAVINLSSHEALADYIEHVLKWPDIKRRGKNGKYLVGKDSMNEWKRLGYADAALFLEAAQLRNVYSTFVGNETKNTGLWQYKTADGKVHPIFLVMLARSGRNRSSDPNFQNIPKRSKLSKLIRAMFGAPPNYVIFESDGAGLQLRIAASLSNDARMRETFVNSDGDLHSITGHEVFAYWVEKYPMRLSLASGAVVECESGDPVQVLRNGVKETFLALEVQQTDEFLQLANTDDLKDPTSPPDRIVDLTSFREAAVKLTVEDFKHRKKWSVYKTWRTLAKNVNFGLLFGATAIGFGTGLLYREWTDVGCQRFVDKEGLNDRAKEWATNERIGNERIGRYVAAAERIIEKFFGLYPGLREWQKNQIQFARQNGYIRSAFGARRLLPQLVYRGKDDDKGRVKNLENISCNSPVQNHEVIVMNRSMLHLVRSTEASKQKSVLIGNVHDAIVGYIHKREINKLVPLIDEALAIDWPENNGIPYQGATNLADPEKGEYWGFGKLEIESDDVDDFWFDEDNYDPEDGYSASA